MKNGILFHRAAAMTYRIFIAIIPILMALFSVISYLGEDLRLTIISFMQSAVPDYAWPAVADMITDIVTKQNGTRLYGSFFVGLFLAVISVNAILNILNTTYFADKQRPFFKQLMVALLICFIAFATLFLTAGIFILTEMLINYLDVNFFQSNIIHYQLIVISKWILLFSVLYIFISLFYFLALPSRKNYRFFSAGSTLSSISMLLILSVLNYYFSNISNFNLLYGSLGAIFAILLWIYWNALFILIGFDLNVSVVTAKLHAANNIRTEK